ncbi:hypothetical protein D477_014181 [Arthrobacter crystallopoietes BAB-32]|uniref:Uncharacterized protein n=2 Tax=Crystallibacter crystallopoietes TaxID=37928 RepID=N1UT13_9MICC|nr:hypothetical protein D477_014181 [Arthrobacter crystallopoietes BAB-32]
MAQGLILFLPRIGITVVPFREYERGWYVVVVDGNKINPVGGYHLSICDEEIATAIEVRLGEQVESRIVHTAEAAEELPDGQLILANDGRARRKREDSAGTTWTAFLRASVSTGDLHLPAKVLGVAK